MSIQSKIDAVLEYLKQKFPGIPVQSSFEFESEMHGAPTPAERGHVSPNGVTFRVEVDDSIKLLHLSRKFLDDRSTESIGEYLRRENFADELRKKGDRTLNIP